MNGQPSRPRKSDRRGVRPTGSAGRVELPIAPRALSRRSAERALLPGLLLLFLCWAACAREQGKAGPDISTRPVRVVTTIGMLTDVVRNIGGDRVEVTGLMGPGVDPHLFKASAGDVTAMQQADIVFYNGLHLEGAMGKLFHRMAGARRTVAAAEAIPPERLQAHDDSPGLHDPHVWFDVTLWMEVARAVATALEELDPAHAEGYRERLGVYLRRLEALHAWARARAEELPLDRRVLITAHDAFRYFGRAYGFEVHGLQGISTVAEAGTSDLRELAGFIVERRVPAIFVESSVPRRTIRALQAAVEARGFSVTIGGELYSDALGDPTTPEGSYEGMIRHNVDTIVDALKGAPARSPDAEAQLRSARP